jgi:RNA polymerase sigma-70 factor (ECF subfamily)
MDINHALAAEPLDETPTAGAALVISARPSARWFRFTARVAGVPIGRRCRLVVVARDGGEYIVGTVDGESSVVDGIALLAPWQVYAVELRTAAGVLLDRRRMI